MCRRPKSNFSCREIKLKNVKFAFNIDDRVSRRENAYDINSPVKTGKIYKRYSKQTIFNGVSWTDLQVYDVIWDDGKVEVGFFPHGLSRVSDLCPGCGKDRNNMDSAVRAFHPEAC